MVLDQPRGDETQACATIVHGGVVMPWRYEIDGRPHEEMEACGSVNRKYEAVSLPQAQGLLIKETASDFLMRGEGTIGSVTFWQVGPNGLYRVLQLPVERRYEVCPDGSRGGGCDEPRSRSMSGEVRVEQQEGRLFLAYSYEIDARKTGGARFVWNGQSFISAGPDAIPEVEILEGEENATEAAEK